MQTSLAAFRDTFRQAHSAGQQLLDAALARKDTRLRAMMQYAIAKQTTSEYPFVFKYSFCRTERDAARLGTLPAAVHLLQSSAFISDDILDNSDLRYRQPTIHTKYGVSNAIVATELMQSIALEAIASELETGKFHNECQVLRIFNRIVRELYVGQYLDVYHTGDVQVSAREYYRVIALGVGNYFANVARCGALLAGKPPEEIAALTRYGYHYGMALFITDDIVDVLYRPKVTGKSYACDLKNRRMRLPVIFALRMANGDAARSLRTFLRCGDPARREIERAAAIIEQSGALEKCLSVVRRHVAESLKTLEGLPPGATPQHFCWLSETLLRAQKLENGIPARNK